MSLCVIRLVLVGIAVTLGTIGKVIGPMIGGALTEISWRWCMHFHCCASILRS